MVLVVDEEGALKDNPKVNVSGTLLFGGLIYGNIMVVKENGAEFEGLTYEEMSNFTAGLAHLLGQLRL